MHHVGEQLMKKRTDILIRLVGVVILPSLKREATRHYELAQQKAKEAMRIQTEMLNLTRDYMGRGDMEAVQARLRELGGPARFEEMGAKCNRLLAGYQEHQQKQREAIAKYERIRRVTRETWLAVGGAIFCALAVWVIAWTIKGENPWFNELGEQYSNQPMGGK